MIVAIVSFVVYVIAVLAVGVWAAGKPQRSAEEIHLGGRQHGKWTSALSASASTESGFVLLGMVGMGYSIGANALWIVPAGIFGYMLMWLVLGPKLRDKSLQLKVVTVPELIAVSTGGGRISKIATTIASFLALIFLIAYVAAQFNAAGKALSTQFNIPFGVGVFIGGALVTIYAVLGGFRAVSWTDNIQAVMMAFALVVLPSVIVFHLGGFGAVLDSLRAIDPKLTSLTGGAKGEGVVMAILPWLMLGLAYPGQPHAVARLMAAKDENVFGPASVIAIIWFILIYSGAVVLGMAARAGFSDVAEISLDPERTLPVLALQFLPGIIAGVIVASVMAAISSTADSTLLSAATTVVRDLRAAFRCTTDVTPQKSSYSNNLIESVQELSTESRKELVTMRIVIIVLAAFATGIALSDDTGNVFGLVLYAWSGLGASLGPVTLYCALTKRPQPIPALAGLLVGGCLAFGLHGHNLGLLIGFGASLTTLILAHIFTLASGRKREA